MEKKQRFSLRKLKNGVASVAIGALLVSAQAVDVEASTPDQGDQDVLTEEGVTPTPLGEDGQVDSTEEVVVTPDVVQGESQKVEPVEKNVQNVNVTGETETEEVVVSEPVVERHQGADREEVAINVAEKHFSDAEKAIIVNQDKYTDAISATNISQGEYPVLYTRADQIGDKTLLSLGKMENLKEIYLLGGTTSIGESIESRLTNALSDITITRIDGADRFEANAKAIRETFMVKADGDDGEVKDKITSDHVVIASGETYTDALYGVSYANTLNGPIILSKTDRLVDESVQLIKDLGTTKVTIVGGPNTVNESLIEQLEELGISEENINRIAGANRYDGSVEVARNSYENPETVLIASGDIFTDALVSAPLAQKLDAPILLVRANSIVDEVEKYLNDGIDKIKTIYIQGGPATVSEANAETIKRAASNIIEAEVTVEAVDENTVNVRFFNEEEEYDETETVELEEPLVDGEEQEITFEHAGRDYTVNVLYVTAQTVIEKIGDLKRINEIEQMDAEELAEERTAIEKARSFYNALTDQAKADDTVIEREKWLGLKEEALEAREEELDDEA